MATATQLAYQQVCEILVAPDLHPCNVVRLNCVKCGEYTVYLGPEALPPVNCSNCRRSVSIVAVARGWTKREIPWVSVANPTMSTNMSDRPDTRQRREYRGAPNKLSDTEAVEARSMYAGGNGKTALGIAKHFGVSKRTVWRVLKGDA